MWLCGSPDGLWWKRPDVGEEEKTTRIGGGIMALALGKDKHLRILLADDHSLFRAGMRYLLDELHLQVEVDEADTCQGVLDALHNEHYDLILMDLLMPGMDQVSGIRAAKEIAPDTPIAVVSMLETAADIRRAIAAGAAG